MSSRPPSVLSQSQYHRQFNYTSTHPQLSAGLYLLAFHVEREPSPIYAYPPGKSLHPFPIVDHLEVPEGRFTEPQEFGNNCATWESRSEEDAERFAEIVKAEQIENSRYFASVLSLQRCRATRGNQPSLYTSSKREGDCDIPEHTIENYSRECQDTDSTKAGQPRRLLSPEFARRRRKRPTLRNELGALIDQSEEHFQTSSPLNTSDSLVFLDPSFRRVSPVEQFPKRTIKAADQKQELGRKLEELASTHERRTEAPAISGASLTEVAIKDKVKTRRRKSGSNFQRPTTSTYEAVHELEAARAPSVSGAKKIRRAAKPSERKLKNNLEVGPKEGSARRKPRKSRSILLQP